MKAPLKISHNHVPIFRVVRRSWTDPLETAFSKRTPRGNRWNTQEFAALYCCCSEIVARAVVLDVFRLAGVEFEELQPAYQPQLAEISWEGEVLDVSSVGGISAAGLPDDYPRNVDHASCQTLAAKWQAEGCEGLVCRSASVARLGYSSWEGPHVPWGELVIFVENARRRPHLVRRREDTEWLAGIVAEEAPGIG